ncbi:MAG: ATP-binding protein [Deltaproteobacteria bacterium]|nr:ATP-binding protein [Deltaproteobacteria bacterium]
MDLGLIPDMSAVLPPASNMRGQARLPADAGALKPAARAFLNKLPFDGCAVYLWDRQARRFTLKASYGIKAAVAAQYAAKGGVLGRMKRPFRHIILKGQGIPRKAANGREEHGTILAYPLMDRRRLSGAVILTSRKATRPGLRVLRLVEAASTELVLALKYAELMSCHKDTCDELRLTKERFQNAERLIMLADMTATLAHEIKNPLVSIGGFAARLKKKLDPCSPALKYAEQILSEAKRIEDIINGAVRFLKDSVPDLRLGDINGLLDAAVGVFEDDLDAQGINVVKNYSGAPITVLVDREQLKIAFDNLIANAIQSMKGGGTLTLATSSAHGWAIAEITDSGGGIDPKIIGHIFNPFYTTKAAGTGLGLTITNSIIMRHKGVIEVVNKIGAGATFSVRLPYAQSA